MALTPGARLDVYEVLSLVGAGGMGEVYRARDTLLKRDVAIKVLPAYFSHDPDRLRRFEQEAQATAALNHPNILAIYKFGTFDGAPYIVSELLSCETLRAELGHGPFPVRKAINYGVQIAQGFAAAHEKGIVHRDLKPENLFVTKDGRVKILDFGLAKLIQPQSDPEGTTPTETVGTVSGVVMGTVGYMSPEQVRGTMVDHRTDIFSFGAILYEMVAGKRAFQRPTPAETMTAILIEDPQDILQIEPTAPPGLQRIMQRCLEKKPDQRFQSASDLAFAIEALSQPAVSPGTANSSLPRRALALATAAYVAVAAVGLAVYMTPPAVSGPLDSTQVTSSAESKQGPLFTDGSRIYLNGQGEPSEMSVTGGSIVPMRLLGSGMTMLDISADASKVLALKPDMDDNIGRGTLWTASMLGGMPRRLSDHLAFAARWAPDGRSLAFSDQRTLYTMDADGQNIKKIWDAPADLGDLGFSPDGQQLTLVVRTAFGNGRLWNVRADGRDAHALEFDWPKNVDQNSGQWTPDGQHFLFSSDRGGRGNVYELVAPHWYEFWKKPVAVRITGNQVSIQAFIPSRDGKGLFVLGRMDEGAMRAYDPHSGKLVPFLDDLSMLEFVIAPDRKWMAYSEFPSRNLWKSKLDGSERMQLTNSSAVMQQWSPDGKWLVYSDWHNLYLVSTDGGAPEKLTADGHGDVAPTWSPDGKSIAFNYYPFPGQPHSIRLLDLSSRQVSTMPNTAGYFVPSWSPDGQYLVAIAENPSRMVLYTAKTGTWKDLHLFDSPWGYWTWAADSKSIFMGDVLGNNGIYRLTVPGGEWRKLSGLEGVNEPSGADSFLSLTAEGQPAIMSRNGVAQLYLLNWKH